MAKTKQKQVAVGQKENKSANQQTKKANLTKKAPLNKVQTTKNAGKVKKVKKTKKVIETKPKEDVVVLPSTRNSDDPIPNKVSFE